MISIDSFSMREETIGTDLIEGELTMQLRLTGPPESISRLRGEMVGDQLDADSIARLASALGGSYSEVPNAVVVVVYPQLPDDKAAARGEGRIIPVGQSASIPMRWIQHRIGIPSEARVMEGSVDVVVTQPR